MENFVKYLAPVTEEKNWGFHITVAGHSQVPPGINYPIGKHPKGYHFRWENGRILNEYQIIYITEGEGIFESRQFKAEIKPGTIILLHPGAWHRYKPQIKTGWRELYIGFAGDAAERLISNSLLNKVSILHCGWRENLLESYQKIFELVLEENPGSQILSSGEVIKLIGTLINNLLSEDLNNTVVRELIDKAKFRIQQNLDQKINFKNIADSLNMGYSNFRKLFKKYTGYSPNQYHLNHRIIKAKELLLHSDKQLKEIAWETGFFSISYFSRMYCKKTGQPPSVLRK